MNDNQCHEWIMHQQEDKLVGANQKGRQKDGLNPPHNKIPPFFLSSSG